MMTNTTTSRKPVIFLAFANDRVDDTAYLRNLPKELAGIRNALQKAVKAGLCELVERANATIEQILDVFQDDYYKDRIGIFHYGGHANGYQLLLETMDGKHASAHSEGLVSFLAKQQGLKMVFLNGCSSQQQALDLVASGIPTVIGTSQSINDDIATKLAVRFYKGLGSGKNIDRAWQEAVDEAKIEKGTANMRDFYWDGDDSDTADSEAASVATQLDRFPWDIHYREGAELVRQWNLPEAVENPLFGLPDPDRQNLPDQPFRFLERYKREHADIFFGRSYYIRDLYNTAVDTNAAPIVLLYGQSGVGKSSMLDAGLFPRLEQVAQVVYIRRKQRLGLLGTLKRALGVSKHQAENIKSYEGQAGKREQITQLEDLVSKSSGDTKEKLAAVLHDLQTQFAQEEEALQQKAKKSDITDASSLLEVWKHAEAKAEKPLIILLDQVEEIFTRPNQKMPNELEEFLQEIQHIFGYPKERPQGKIILSYRKEYHPEINEACKNFSIPREETFLRALERKDIVDVILGLTKTERLQRKYRLTVESTLPVVIADDLLEDKDSPIAPVLQILLTKMWKISEEENEDHHFTVDHYQTLRTQGILMDDFFKEQMEILDVKYPNEIKSGLALDILDNHTTKMGTADTRNLDELRERYADRQEVIDKLLKEFKRLYLLTDIGTETTGLAHDTLAPLVQDEFRHSDKPGQRAALILENKMIAYEQEPDTVIDVDDLKIVEAGAGGMRLWTLKEQELIDKSQARRKRLVYEEKRNKRILFGLLGIVFIAILGAFIISQISQSKLEAQKNIAEDAEKTALKAKDDALAQKAVADSAKNDALAQKAVADSATVKAAAEAKRAEQERIKAEESAITAQKAKEAAEKSALEADAAKVEAQQNAKKALEQKALADTAKLEAIAQGNIAKQQLYLAKAKEIASKSSVMLDNDTLKALLAMKSYELENQAYTYDSTQDAHLQDSHEIFEAMERAVTTFNKDSLYGGESWDFKLAGKQVILSSERGKMILGKIEPQGAGKLPIVTNTIPVSTINPKARVYAISHVSNQRIAYGMSDGSVVLHDGNKSEKLYAHPNANILSLAYATEKNWLLSTADDNKIMAWDLSKQAYVPNGTYTHDVPINQIKTSQDLVFGIDRDGRVLFWELGKSGQKPIILWEHPTAPLVSLAYSPKNKWLAFGASNGELFIMNINDPSTIRKFNKRHKGKVSALTFSPNELFLASASFDGSIMSWKLDQAQGDLQSLTNQVPAIIQGGRKIFSLNFDPDGKHLIFSDKNELRVRIIDPAILYEKLQSLTEGKSLTPEQQKIYVGLQDNDNK